MPDTVPLAAKTIVLNFSAKVACAGEKEECWLFDLSYCVSGGVKPYPGPISTKPKSVPANEEFWKKFRAELKDYRRRIAGDQPLTGKIDFSFRGQDGLITAQDRIEAIVREVFSELA